MLVATFDIGTTAVKAVTVRDDGEPVFTGSQVLHTIEKNGFKEQDPEEWYSAFCTLSHALTGKIPAQEISALIFSGQMQDVIPIGSDRRALGNAILYSDGRVHRQKPLKMPWAAIPLPLLQETILTVPCPLQRFYG